MCVKLPGRIDENDIELQLVRCQSLDSAGCVTLQHSRFVFEMGADNVFPQRAQGMFGRFDEIYMAAAPGQQFDTHRAAAGAQIEDDVTVEEASQRAHQRFSRTIRGRAHMRSGRNRQAATSCAARDYTHLHLAWTSAFPPGLHRFTLSTVQHLRRIVVSFTVALCLFPGCDHAPSSQPSLAPIQVRTIRPSRHRVRVAAVTIRFAHSGLEPGKISSGYDRLQVGAVFADAGRRDVHLVHNLSGQMVRGPNLSALDTCIRQAGALDAMVHSTIKPAEHMRLLDIGNLVLHSGRLKLPLRISMVPSLFSAIRGVRYDIDLDNARHWLASSTLALEATGGDGVAAFKTTVAVPRPVRFTRVGGAPVRAGHVVVGTEPSGLAVRWGSVDGAASLEVVVGTESGKGLNWVRCRLRDDGAFVIPSGVLNGLPPRSPRRPWLISLIRTATASIPGFDGRPVRLELVDSVRVR